MENNSLKNELLFQYAAGTTSIAKSLMASTYLYLNSSEQTLYSQFEEYCGNELKNSKDTTSINISPVDCISQQDDKPILKNTKKNPIDNFIVNLKKVKWKKVFNGFYEYSFNLTNKEKAKLIKMTPGAKVPIHSHNGKEYILVLEGSFCDEYGNYTKGNLQINDQRIKHTPFACKNQGCICLIITEDILVFYGPFAPLLNIATFIKSLFSGFKY